MVDGAVGTQERSDYEQLRQLDRTAQLQEFVEKSMELTHVWLEFMSAGLRMIYPNLPTTWQQNPVNHTDRRKS